MPILYGGLLPKAYGASMDAKSRANDLKPSKQLFSFRKDSKATTLGKSKPCIHSRFKLLAMFYCKVFDVWVNIITVACFNFREPFFFLDRALYAIAFSALILESFIYGLGFNSQTLNGCLQLFQVMR